MTPDQLETIVKGFANHRRIQMLRLLERSADLSMEDIAVRLSINEKTASEHLRRLALAGLITKRYKGRFVLHRMTGRGLRSLEFLKNLK